MTSSKTLEAYTFFGETINCKEKFCEKASQGSSKINIIEEMVMRSQVVGNVTLPCAFTTVVEMNEDFPGFDVTFPAPDGVAPESSVTVHLPSSLKHASKKTAKVVCTFFHNSSLFQEKHSRTCVSWDTRIDPGKVKWKEDGCVTVTRGARETECQCHHLTYFTILVQLEPRPVRNLLALTIITYFGNLISAISCFGLIFFLCRKRRVKEQSNHIHLGLAASLFVLNVLFFLTGTLANVVGGGLCSWVGAGLHYAMLSSFTWMAMEVFHTFWLVYVVFSPSPKVYPLFRSSYSWLSGTSTVCWMTSTPEAQLAHYLINISLLALLVSSGLVMLFLVYRKIRTRNEWRHNSVAFLSIWGLS
ncbi:hypothetical protein CRUP_002760 [Coryphaenoides rupestris]|nr:hypothetical protein CRUP_002760 [Coryphaenoides rupestris]